MSRRQSIIFFAAMLAIQPTLDVLLHRGPRGPLVLTLDVVFSLLSMIVFVAAWVIPDKKAAPWSAGARKVRVGVALGILVLLLGLLGAVAIGGWLEDRGLAFWKPKEDWTKDPMVNPGNEQIVQPRDWKPYTPPAEDREKAAELYRKRMGRSGFGEFRGNFDAAPPTAPSSPQPESNAPPTTFGRSEPVAPADLPRTRGNVVIPKWTGAAPEYVEPPDQPGTPTELVGGPEGWQFQEFDEKQRAVIGFRHDMGSWDGIPSVAEFQPIYEGDRARPEANMVLASDGYVVGGLHVVGERFVNAIRVVFVRQQPNGSLDASDSYLSEWIGEPGDYQPTVLGDGKTRVIGVCGRNGAIKNAIALILDNSPAEGAARAAPSAPKRSNAAKATKVAIPKWTGAAPEYVEPPNQPGRPTELVGGPEGWQFQAFDRNRRAVVGFRHGMGSWDRIPSVAQFDPIYEGDRAGRETNVVIAKDGYAVGGLQVVGERFVNAIRVIFVRQNTDGTLDKSDNYLSDWIGEPGDNKPKVLGDGKTRVIGVCGRNGAVKNAIALILDGE